MPDSSVAGSGYYQLDGAYGALFSADLAYQQVDGSVIGRLQLLRDVALQFRRRNRGKRIRFIRRSWRLNRRAAYVWTKGRAAWTIKRVQVFSEEIRNSGWRVGPVIAKYTEIESDRRDDGGAGPKRDTVFLSEIRNGTTVNRTYPGRLAGSRRIREGRSR